MQKSKNPIRTNPSISFVFKISCLISYESTKIASLDSICCFFPSFFFVYLTFGECMCVRVCVCSLHRRDVVSQMDDANSRIIQQQTLLLHRRRLCAYSIRASVYVCSRVSVCSTVSVIFLRIPLKIISCLLLLFTLCVSNFTSIYLPFLSFRTYAENIHLQSHTDLSFVLFSFSR